MAMRAQWMRPAGRDGSGEELRRDGKASDRPEFDPDPPVGLAGLLSMFL